MSPLVGRAHNVLSSLGFRVEESEEPFAACYLSVSGKHPVAWVRTEEVGWQVAVAKRAVPKLAESITWERLAEQGDLPANAAFAVPAPDHLQLRGVLELIAHAMVPQRPAEPAPTPRPPPAQAGAERAPMSALQEAHAQTAAQASTPAWQAIDALLAEAEQGKAPPETVVRAIRDIRVGQDRFRAALMKHWDGACAVTGLRVRRLLRASHCKPWAQSSGPERLEPHNGLLLAAHLDAAFDAGYLTFTDEGAIILSPLLTEADKQALSLRHDMRLRHVQAEHAPYLHWHRDHVFLANP